MRFALVSFWIALLGYGALFAAPAAIADETAPMIPKAWLIEKVTVAEAEAAHPGIKDDRVARFPDAAKPFGFRHREWEEFKVQMLPADELWTFSSPPDSWGDLAGRAGVALVRNGVPIGTIVTVMN
jgi:hypothetical protein